MTDKQTIILRLARFHMDYVYTQRYNLLKLLLGGSKGYYNMADKELLQAYQDTFHKPYKREQKI